MACVGSHRGHVEGSVHKVGGGHHCLLYNAAMQKGDLCTDRQQPLLYLIDYMLSYL